MCHRVSIIPAIRGKRHGIRWHNLVQRPGIWNSCECDALTCAAPAAKRGETFALSMRTVLILVRIFIYIYILCISSYFYYPEREFARLIVTLDENRLCWFYLEIRLCSLWIFFFFCYYFRRYFWVEELKIEIDHRFGKVSRTFYSFLFLAKMCFYRRWIYRKYNVSRWNEILQSIWKLREKIVESIYKVRSFLASFPLNKFCDICIKVVSK